MIHIPLPFNEVERVTAVKSYGVLDTPAEDEYDAITKLASAICGTPISLITLIDDKRQWFKSAFGAGDVRESGKEYAFCSYAVADPRPIFIVPDLRMDERFADNPFVTNDPHVVFYAGVPLVDGDGFALGTLCVLDGEVKKLNEFQIDALKLLAGQVVSLLNKRRKIKTLQTFTKLLEERVNELEETVSNLREAKPALQNLSRTIALLQTGAGSTANPTSGHLLKTAEEQISLLRDALNQL